MRPLEGIPVVALEQAVAAPFATRQLADLGARVIKIERPGGGDFARDYDQSVKGMAAHFVWLNRSKESLTLDVKHPQAQEILARLLATADVFIQNLAPGAAERLGAWGPGRLRTRTPETPSKVGISIVDISAGMYAYSGILTALLQRGKTGKGTRVEVTMFEALGEWMGYPLYYTHFSGKAPGRSGPDHATIVPYGRFPAGDGKYVMLGLQNEREGVVFCEQILGRPGRAQELGSGRPPSAR